MKVVLLSRGAHPLHPPGGMERAVYQLAKHLGALGVETTLVTRPPSVPGARFPGKVLEVPYGGPHPGHGTVLDRTLRYPRFAHRAGLVAADLVRSGADIVHAQGLTALGYGRLRARDPGLRAPLLMNPQGMEEHKTTGLKRLALSRLRRLSLEAARLSDRVIATDRSTEAEVESLLGIQSDRIVVLPNGIDFAEIEALTPEDPSRAAEGAFPSLVGASPVFLSVGRLEAYKGFKDVLDGLWRVRAALPPSWVWVVVGQGPDRAALQKECGDRMAKERALLLLAGRPEPRGHFLLAGRVDEGLLHALYARADVFVHATHFEGSSLVTLEAMAHGLPVVATRAGGIPDKVSEQTGRLVLPGDVASLSAALLELAGNPPLRSRLGDEGHKKALDEFHWPALARKTIAIYEDLLREERGRRASSS